MIAALSTKSDYQRGVFVGCPPLRYRCGARLKRRCRESCAPRHTLIPSDSRFWLPFDSNRKMMTDHTLWDRIYSGRGQHIRHIFIVRNAAFPDEVERHPGRPTSCLFCCATAWYQGYRGRILQQCIPLERNVFCRYQALACRDSPKSQLHV